MHVGLNLFERFPSTYFAVHGLPVRACRVVTAVPSVRNHTEPLPGVGGHVSGVRLTVPALTPQSCHSENGLPDSVCTPGEVRTTDAKTSAMVAARNSLGRRRLLRTPLKRQQLIAYGYADTNPADYEEDHLISLELGGSGADPKNLWPEPHAGKDNSFDKDKVENWLHRQICSGAMTPGEAQRGINTDWRQFLPQVNCVVAKKKEIQ